MCILGQGALLHMLQSSAEAEIATVVQDSPGIVWEEISARTWQLVHHVGIEPVQIANGSDNCLKSFDVSDRHWKVSSSTAAPPELLISDDIGPWHARKYSFMLWKAEINFSNMARVSWSTATDLSQERGVASLVPSSLSCSVGTASLPSGATAAQEPDSVEDSCKL
eukprot:CAMPEP_0169336740 /NCGR_PEP_ID=MMETSP1017-20121227/17037_1 /TAXON_ID=342587 /ORGANISM="Karlodinium micrum, Strain CCMP2283" /LENGTH=165 /DNA_ID=CAMNT_0009432215 /DNA_START=484 /DNA_END=982 /DNA_ORIENTATION=+